ncbi:hypothetical protein MM214_17810 [Belliella kenyensis]|nr:hypothetical protein [Belliella kenyensis]MCH7403722.1 hypothetical protein [Belliella kenyensis]MDN3602489.1 hypothetical protein [Belliella kenyensis]
MKSRLFLITISILYLVISSSYAQTGLGTVNPNPSAILEMDVSSLAVGSKKGFLLPRVALTGTDDVITIQSPINGLLIYNTSNTVGAYAVQANKVYTWNTSSQLWERYFAREEISGFIETKNYSIQSTTGQQFSPLNTFNAGNLVDITWQASEVIFSNSDIISLDSDNTSFTVMKTGIYDISGFFNCHPQRPETSSTNTQTSNQTDVVFVLQKFTGGSWETINATIYALGRGVGNTFSSIPYSSTTVSFAAGEKLRFRATRNTGLNRLDHGANAGIVANTGQITKSLRISLIIED